MIFQLVQYVIAGAMGATVMYASVHLFHWPHRPVRKWEDEMLQTELAEAKQHYSEGKNEGSAGYLMGLNTAAMMLGTVEPRRRQEQARRRKARSA